MYSRVSKFGGTSLSTFETMSLSADKVPLQRDGNQVVVLSACATITDLLDEMASRVYIEESQIIEDVSEIEFFHQRLAAHIPTHEIISRQIKHRCATLQSDLLMDCSPEKRSRVLSVGEDLSCVIFKGVLQARGHKVTSIDARDLISMYKVPCGDPAHIFRTPGGLNLDWETTKANISRELLGIGLSEACYDKRPNRSYIEPGVKLVQGFLASDDKGQTCLLGRGGSDYSASIIASAVEADVLYIWTDVEGIYTKDPNKYNTATRIPRMNYLEARAIANSSARVLHANTIEPLLESRIPLFVGSSQGDGFSGTWIGDDTYFVPISKIGDSDERLLNSSRGS